MELNQGQKQAVCFKDGPCMVLAGPGSGKTRVITERARELVERQGVAPQHILVITFTKAASMEMKNRFLRLTDGRYPGVQFGTFHAIFFTILKHAYHYSVNNIIKESEKKRCLQEIISGMELEIQNETEFLMDVESEISLVKGQRISLENYYSANAGGEEFRSIYKQYQAYLERKRLLDFDDMLVYCYELLSQRKDILAAWQQQFAYILIDEFQDISKIQYDIIRMLAEPQNNLFIVGDDDQSIYRFRGAKPEIMLHFPEDYPRAQVIRLGVNYRCAPAIVEAAGKLIGNNQSRFEKEIHASEEKTPKGGAHPGNGELVSDGGVKSGGGTVSGDNAQAVDICGFANVSEQNGQIVQLIRKAHKEGMRYKDMAVLVRTNTGGRMISGLFSRYQIPFRMKDRLPNIFEHWIARNILAYIQIARGNTERHLYLQIANRPVRYISREAFDSPVVDFDRVMEFYEDKSWMLERLEEFAYALEMLSDMMPYAAVNYILKGIGYEEYLTEYARESGVREEELLQLAEEVRESAKNYKSYEEWFAYMEQYKRELEEQFKRQNDRKVDAVQIVTMHESKGLEYDEVYIPDANEGVMPHNKAVLDADVEEERRMFYVAMTRARKKVHIYYAKERFHKHAVMSRFVEELQKDV